jgi:hypothetical protein
LYCLDKTTTPIPAFTSSWVASYQQKENRVVKRRKNINSTDHSSTQQDRERKKKYPSKRKNKSHAQGFFSPNLRMERLQTFELFEVNVF